jgi:hypothetical protein
MRTIKNPVRLYEVRLNGGASHEEYTKWYQNVRVELKGAIDSYEATPNVYVVASAGGEEYVIAAATHKMKKKHRNDVSVAEITKASLAVEHRNWKPLVEGYYSFVDIL